MLWSTWGGGIELEIVQFSITLNAARAAAWTVMGPERGWMGLGQNLLPLIKKKKHKQTLKKNAIDQTPYAAVSFHFEAPSDS